MRGMIITLRQPFTPPRAGWWAVGLGALAMLTPSLAAMQSPLEPPASAIGWASLLGFLIGLDGGSSYQTKWPRWRRMVHWGVHVAIWVFGSLIAILAAGSALPPWSLFAQDLAGQIALAQGGIADPLRTPSFLRGAFERLVSDLSLAPQNGQIGARLLVAVAGSLVIWLGALGMGRALGGGRYLLQAGVCFLAALALVALPGGTGGLALWLGMLAILICVAIAGHTERIARWEQQRIDYSDELGRDVALATGMLVLITLGLAWAIPLWPGNPIARWMAELGTPPSGVAALEGAGFQPNPTADIGLSTLPSLRLGVSIAQGPPEQPAFRITPRPLPPAEPGPRYWRVRIFDRYNGRIWSAAARITNQEAGTITANFNGAIVQEIEDFRPDRELIVGLPDILAVNVPSRAERLANGDLAALAATPPSPRYQVVSRLQELAELPQLDREPPDLSFYRALPADLPPRVRELAQAIVGDLRADRDRALAIEAYLRSMPYSYRVAPIPAEGDAVDQFLFEMRSGYCTYYASAMAVMLRSLGIPARVAVGYVQGEATNDGGFLVREADAHAWAEAYINGRWVPFEPTPIRALPGRAEPGLNDGIVVAEAPTTQESQAWVGVVLLLSISLLAAGVVGGWWWRRQPRVATDPLTRATETLAHIGRQSGIEWRTGVTVREYARLVGERLRTAIPTINTLAQLIERGRYSRKRLDIGEENQLEVLRSTLQQSAQPGVIPAENREQRANDPPGNGKGTNP